MTAGVCPLRQFPERVAIRQVAVPPSEPLQASGLRLEAAVCRLRPGPYLAAFRADSFTVLLVDLHRKISQGYEVAFPVVLQWLATSRTSSSS